jgi:hypothetical protein
VTRVATSLVLSGLAAAAVLVFAALAPFSADGKTAALLGASFSGAAGGLALLLKHRALLKPGIGPVLRANGIAFALRLLLAAEGVFIIARSKGGELHFVIAFMAVYALQQIVELHDAEGERPRISATPEAAREGAASPTKKQGVAAT